MMADIRFGAEEKKLFSSINQLLWGAY